MKKFKFRLQTVLDMRVSELEQRQMEAAKILAMVREQEAELKNIIKSQLHNSEQMENLYNLDVLNIQQIEAHREFGIKLTVDIQNQERKLNNTKMFFTKKQKEVQEAHKKVEVLKKLKEKQEKEYYKEFLDAEIKEVDDITSARFKF